MFILGLGHAHPPTELDNGFLESLDIGLTSDWIASRIGIATRRTVLSHDYIRETRNSDPRAALEVMSHTPTSLGVEAARMALARAGVEASEVGLLVANGSTPLETVPAEAHRLAEALGIRCPGYDLQGACPTFALHLSVLLAMGDSLPEYVLCVSTSTFTAVIDYSAGADAAILGDGAAAWLVSPRAARGLRVVAARYDSDPARCAAIRLPRFGHFHQDGRAVRSFSVRRTVRELRSLAAEHSLDWGETRFIGHQANAIMLDSVCQHVGIPDHNHWRNVVELGNQAGAGAPATLSMQATRLSSPDRVAVAVVGAGLGWGCVLLEAL